MDKSIGKLPKHNRPKRTLTKEHQLLAHKVFNNEAVTERNIVDALRNAGLSRKEAQRAVRLMMNNHPNFKYVSTSQD